jgi:hypothetical protein
LWKEFLAVVAAVDLVSRAVHCHMLSDSLHKEFSLDALEIGGRLANKGCSLFPWIWTSD